MALLVHPAAAHGAPAAAAALADGAVVDTRDGVIYLARPAGGIEAIGVASGGVRWEASIDGLPLGLVDDRLIVFTEASDPELRVTGLDVRSGDAVFTVGAPLPAGLRPHVVDRPEERFRVALFTVGQELVVAWEAEKRPISPVGPPRREERPSALREGGSRRGGTFSLERGTHRLVGRSGAQPPGMAVPRIEERPPSGAGSGGARVFLSIDGRHELHSELMTPVEIVPSYRWTVFDRHGGQRLGEIVAQQSATPFVVVADALLRVTGPRWERVDGDLRATPLSVEAYDLPSGVRLWQRELRDVVFRGAPPP